MGIVTGLTLIVPLTRPPVTVTIPEYNPSVLIVDDGKVNEEKEKVFNFVCAHGNSTDCSRREGNDGLAKQHVRICKNCDRWVKHKIGVRAGEEECTLQR